MTSEQFVFWLQGLYELAEPTELNAKQTELIKKHLELVFIHEVGPKLEKATPGLTKKHEAHVGGHGGREPLLC